MPDSTGLVFSRMSARKQYTFLTSILKKSISHYSVIGTNLKGIITTWNKGARDEYGYSASEIIGKSFSQLYETKHAKTLNIKSILKHTLNAEIYFAELIGIRKNGEYFVSFVNIILRKNGDASPAGFTFISPDLSELQHKLQKCKKDKKMLQFKNEALAESNIQAEDSNRIKNEFLANVSHELRVPLNTIIGFAELMYLGKVGPVSSEHKEYLRDILLGSDRLLRLINDLLDLNKVESGKMEFFPEPVAINELINEIRTIFYNPLSQKKIRLEINIDPLLDNIIIDPARFKQVLYNFVSNALKFSSPNGKVNIYVKPEKKNMFRLEVKDSGIGIPKKELKLLFCPYQQLSNSHIKNAHGTGLGLSLTKKIVEVQGGKVGVKSVLGKGSTFYAILPCSPLSKEKKKYVRKVIKETIDG